MMIAVRKFLDMFFLPSFYSLCIIGIVIAGIFFLNVKNQQEEALLAYERNINIKNTNETLQLELNENINSENLIYKSSDENIIIVDETGKLVTIGEGSAILTVTTIDQEKEQTLTVNVGQKAINSYIKKNPKDNKKTEKTSPLE